MSLASILADAGGGTRIVVRTIALAATATIIGATAFRWVVLRSANAGRIVTGHVDPLVARIGMAAAGALLLAAPWRILGQADAFMSPGEPWIPVIGLVLQTAWGKAALIQLLTAAAALVAFLAASGSELWGWRVALGCSGILAAAPAWMGHAASVETSPFIAKAADILHVGAAGSWAGAVIVLTFVLRHLSRDAMGGHLAAELIARFKPLALTAAAVLLGSGVISAVFNLHSPLDLVRSPYGIMLLGKLAIVATAAGLGRRHSLTSASRARADGARSVVNSIGGEAMLFVVVIAVSALLSASPPPGE